MGFRFRKSINVGPVRFTASKSGISTSIGVKSFRVTKTAKGRVRTTASIPGTGISYVKETGSKTLRKNTTHQAASKPQRSLSMSNAVGEDYQKTMSTKKNNSRIPLIGIIVLLVVTIFGNAASKQQTWITEETGHSPIPQITSDSQILSVDQLHAKIKRALDEALPNQYFLDVDKEAQTITISQWINGVDSKAINKSLRDAEYLQKWNELTRSLADFCTEQQAQVDKNGHPEFAVICQIVNMDNLGQVLAEVIRGQITYDIVEATPAGEYISEPEIGDDTVSVSRTSTSKTSTYILNSNSMVFHTEGCSSASKISLHNKQTVKSSREELIAAGYSPCGKCNP